MSKDGGWACNRDNKTLRSGITVSLPPLAPANWRDKSGIYAILNTQNGKVYIGCSKRLGNRFSQHLATLRRCTHKNLHLQSAWNKYGEEAFELQVLEFVENPYDLMKHEQRYLDTTTAYDREYGYNINPIADGTRFCTSETRERIRAAQLRKPPMSAESKAKISKTLTGRKMEQSVKDKIGAGNLGKYVSEETRKRISAIHKGKTISDDERQRIRNKLKGSKHPPDVVERRGISLRLSWTARKLSGGTHLLKYVDGRLSIESLVTR